MNIGREILRPMEWREEVSRMKLLNPELEKLEQRVAPDLGIGIGIGVGVGLGNSNDSNDDNSGSRD